ncbi:hypothetical protein DTO006G1_3221 [Penicillium roqueforti]|uniref:Indole-diterpene biosynthesis protein PaxU n=1 Tax=Penicillium roqueforti (strain FM164) TaxID=1365484 RepID=W6QA18_PENRF|nr:uncharacterized protein LCP9604111_6309 [Penicillium roqueforti]CDM26632.1 Protein of unknown function DUF829, TMEM53 [Penicillium roqueforti FM164]KAF9247610.1 hypothetical protein LCP9604111_6309 [Penicillium roqueforti]KAI1834951.1 hypothetical protein CBS147337_4505 [Penicillium roqueforti]KAI2676790.1 hypothetical protein CBS147355_5892 [Penicillium roqueforti]KAI2683664.1 hypothetical protein LCP963914a_6065 [Penicillium roqueforti]
MQSVMPSTRLCANTWLSNPEKAIPGQLIIICTWLGASPKHVGKYTDLYRSIAPHARILLIESDVSILVSSYARQRRRIRPVVDIVLETLAETETSSDDNAPRILLHTFSNGGTNTATQLLIILREVASKPLPLIGLVLDSTPAKGTYWKSYNAMVFSLPPASRFVGSMVVHCLLVLLYTWIACGNENPASLMRRTLLDKDTVGPAPQRPDPEARGYIYYMYSKEDRLTDWMDVWEHAGKAREEGWKVKEVVFKGTGHCAHMPFDPMRYTECVEQAWGAISKPESKL